MVKNNGEVRDILYDFINYLEETIVANESSDYDFYRGCIEEVEDYMERFEDDV